MTVEVTVTNPAYWSDRALQLAQLLRRAGQGDGPSTIGDPSGQPVDPDHLLSVSDPAYWSGLPRELQEVLVIGLRNRVATLTRARAYPAALSVPGRVLRSG